MELSLLSSQDAKWLENVAIQNGRAADAPVGIEVTIQQDPLGVVIWHICQLPHVVGQEPILPLSRGHVDIPIQLLGADGFGIKIPDDHLHIVSVSFSGSTSPEAHQELQRLNHVCLSWQIQV